MVAPTRTPQARGVKCDLCKKILVTSTWLDQTQPAKEVLEAQTVLKLIKQHNSIDCPCIPKNIENLLVGSTHFEIHRLVSRQLDQLVHKRQVECYLLTKQRSMNETPKGKKLIINDCYDSEKASRFRTYSGFSDQRHIEQSKLQLKHLCLAIDYWQIAMEDQTNPFNSKLAHRLGLTHHIIYACYLFKYYKILDYQLVTANLLLNVFRSIEGVTPNAQLHAHFLLVKSLIDCDQLQIARHYLKQATRLSNYSDKSHYESILLCCVACELNFLDGREAVYNQLDELADLARIRPNDKLQHYYARTLAIDILMRYIQHYPSKSDHCFEFFHAYRFVCAIIRRCYESSFEIVLAEKELSSKQAKVADAKQNQILDHSWIRFAVCDFVFSTFEHLADFYMRAGMPECLELLYNGLCLVSFRNAGLFWQSKIASIGSRLDLLCDKYNDAKEKLEISTRLVSYTDDPHLMNVLRLESELSLLELLDRQGSVISKDVICDVLVRTSACKSSLVDKLSKIELFDMKSDATARLTYNHKDHDDRITLGSHLGSITLSLLRVGVRSAQRDHSTNDVIDLISKLKDWSRSNNTISLTYFEQQIILEMLLQLADIDKSEQKLLDSISVSQVFFKVNDKACDIQQQLSSLTLNGDMDKTDTNETTKKTTAARRGRAAGKLSLSRASRRRGNYEVAATTEKNKVMAPSTRSLDVMEALENAPSLTKDEIVATYLRNSEPNPDYELYRRAHELLLSFRLTDDPCDHDVLLYHYTESNTSNTMRYRWMMMEEQALAPFDLSKPDRVQKSEITSITRQLSFCNVLVNQENTLKSMIRTIPDNFRLVQFRYILDTKNQLENLLCGSFKCGGEPIFVHAKRALLTDDFFSDAKAQHDERGVLAFPVRFASLIEESKKSLLNNSQRSRIEMRQKIESDMGVILHDLENDWLRSFRFILCSDICDTSYCKFTESLMGNLQATIMKGYTCQSNAALRLAVENAPLLSRQEFCEVISTLFNCPCDSKEPRECFNRWQKSLESFMKLHNLGSNKPALLLNLERAQMGLILDRGLDQIPFESLPIVRITGSGIFRVPSLRLFSIISARRCSPVKVEPDKVAYMLDPANNLAKTRERFDQKLLAQTEWVGTIGHPPENDELERWLTARQLFLFIGHGAGTAYYNKLCKGHGLSHMTSIMSAAIVMGCSSGRMLAEGPRLEPFSIGWVFVFRGSPCYLGLLWDVTDTDIDKYLDTLLDKWMPSVAWSTPAGSKKAAATSCKAITNASAQARHSCQLKLLVGSTPVVYGLPIWCKK